MIVDHYSKRWKIEEFFRTLKTKTQIKSLHRFDDIKDFLKTLSFDAITAYRIAQLEHMAEFPQSVKAYFSLYNSKLHSFLGVFRFRPLSTIRG